MIEKESQWWLIASLHNTHQANKCPFVAIDKQVIHTTIPIHEITHEAPVVHQSQTHAPVPLEHFLSRGGTLRGAISQDAIAKKVLRSGQCSREVDGVAETLERDLRLKGTVSHTRLVPIHNLI